MGFVTCLPTVVGGYDSTWVVVDRLTMSYYFILVWVKYSRKVSRAICQSNYVTTWGSYFYYIKSRFVVYFPFLEFITT